MTQINRHGRSTAMAEPSTGPEPLPEPNFNHLDAAARAEIARLYHEAFRLYGGVALWSMREFEHPTPGHALAITRALRTYAKMPGRQLAEEIERLCHAPDQTPKPDIANTRSASATR
jgi:hypothetical protein